MLQDTSLEHTCIHLSSWVKKSLFQINNKFNFKLKPFTQKLSISTGPVCSNPNYILQFLTIISTVNRKISFYNNYTSTVVFSRCKSTCDREAGEDLTMIRWTCSFFVGTVGMLNWLVEQFNVSTNHHFVMEEFYKRKCLWKRK